MNDPEDIKFNTTFILIIAIGLIVLLGAFVYYREAHAQSNEIFMSQLEETTTKSFNTSATSSFMGQAPAYALNGFWWGLHASTTLPQNGHVSLCLQQADDQSFAVNATITARFGGDSACGVATPQNLTPYDINGNAIGDPIPAGYFFLVSTSTQITAGKFYRLYSGTSNLGEQIDLTASSSSLIYFTLSATRATPTSFDFVDPVNGATTPDFNNWIFNYSNPATSTGHSTEISVNYRKGSSTYQDFAFHLPTGDQQAVNVFKSNALATGTWTAVAGLFDVFQTSSSQTVSLIGSSTISFSVQSGFRGTTSGAVQPSCDTWDVWCHFITWLLVPPAGIAGWMATGVSAFQNSFPFNIVYNFHDSVISATQGLNTAQDYSIVWDLPPPFPASSTLTILTSSTLRDFMGTQNFNLYFQIQSWIIWILAAVGVYKIIT